MDNIQFQLLLDIKGFASAIKSAMSMLENFSKQASGLLNIKPVKFNSSSIDDIVKKNAEFQNSISRASSELKKQSAVSGETSSSISNLSDTTKNASTQQVTLKQGLQNTGLTLLGVQSIIIGLKATFGDFINSYKSYQSALLGVSSIANFKGIKPADVTSAIQSLDLVKNGLLSVADASATMKNFLAANFTLEQSITLLQRFADTAAFGRQGALSFGQAIVSASEGLKNGNSITSDNAGMTKNLSLILKEAGYSEQDLSKATSDVNIRLALFNGIVKETQGQVGDANKLLNSSQGYLIQYEKNWNDVKIALGKILIEGLRPLVTPLTSILEIIAKSPGYVQQSIIAITSLIIVFKLLNTSINPTLKFLAFLAASLIMLPPNVRIFAGGILVLTAAIWAMNGGLTATNVALGSMNVMLGGLPMLIGLVSTGLIAIFSGISGSTKSNADSIKELESRIDEYTNKINSATTANKNLQYVYDYLNGNIEKNDASVTTYNSSLAALREQYPLLYAQIMLYNSGQQEVNKTIQDAVNKNNEYISSLSRARLAEYYNKLDKEAEDRRKINQEIASQIALQDKLIESLQTNGYYDNQGNKIEFDMSGTQSQIDEISGNIAKLSYQQDLFTNDVIQSINVIKEMGGTDDEVKSNMRNHFNYLISQVENGTLSQKNLTDAIASFGVKGVTSFNQIRPGLDGFISQILQARDAVVTLQNSMNLSNFEEQLGKQAKKIKDSITDINDKTQINNAIKESSKFMSDNNIKEYRNVSKKIDAIFNPPAPVSRSSSRSGPAKTEKDEIQELINAWQQSLKFYYASAAVKETLSKSGIASGKNEIQIQSELDTLLSTRTNLTAEQISKLSDFRDEIVKIKEEFNFKPKTLDTFLEDYMKGAYQKWMEQSSRFKNTESWQARSIKEIENAIKLYNDEIELNGSLNQDNIDYIESFISSQLSSINNEKDLLSLKQKINELEKKRNDLIQKRQEAEDYITSLQDNHPFNIFTEDSESFLKKYNDILKIRDEAYNKIDENLNAGLTTENEADLGKLYADTNARESTKKLIFQNVRDALSSSFSSAKQIADILGIGANTFVSRLLSGLNSAVSLVQNMMSLINSVMSIIASVAKVSSLAAGAAVGFASGGPVPGSGNYDSVPAMLTPGEFVISKHNVTSLIHRYGSEFLPWLNGGTLFSSLANRYASGGLVTPSPSQGIVQVPYILSTEIKGQDLNVILTKAKASQARRLI